MTKRGKQMDNTETGGLDIRAKRTTREMSFNEFMDKFVGRFPGQSEAWSTSLWFLVRDYRGSHAHDPVNWSLPWETWVMDFEDFVADHYPRSTGRRN